MSAYFFDVFDFLYGSYDEYTDSNAQYVHCVCFVLFIFQKEVWL